MSSIAKHIIIKLFMPSYSVMSNSLQIHGLQPARLLCPRDFPSKNTGVDCHFLLQGIFLIQESNPRLPASPALQMDSLPAELPGKPWNINYSAVKRNTFELVLMRWMNLEPIIQSEVSQNVKDNTVY